MPAEQVEGCAGCAAEAVDSLIGVAHAENVSVGAPEQGQNIDLGEVGVLKFVNQDEAGAIALRCQNGGIAREHGVCPRNHVGERAQIFFPQPLFRSGIDARDFLAAGDDFLVGQLLFGFGHPRNLRFAALQAGNILRVLFRRDQFVVAAG